MAVSDPWRDVAIVSVARQFNMAFRSLPWMRPLSWLAAGCGSTSNEGTGHVPGASGAGAGQCQSDRQSQTRADPLARAWRGYSSA
jgi:hypothetical protein